MNRHVSQSLTYVTQDIIAYLNEMVADGVFIMHLEMLEKLEEIIMTDETGCFADTSGEPRSGVFQILRTLRVLKDDIRTLNALCPDLMKEAETVDAENFKL